MEARHGRELVKEPRRFCGRLLSERVPGTVRIQINPDFEDVDSGCWRDKAEKGREDRV